LEHVAELVRPVNAENLQAAQLLHVLSIEATTVVKYLPTVQSTHVEPASEYLPAPQGVQELAPSDAEYPAAQSTHVEPASEYLQAVQSTHVEPASEYLPASQVVQPEASPAQGERSRE